MNNSNKIKISKYHNIYLYEEMMPSGNFFVIIDDRYHGGSVKTKLPKNKLKEFISKLKSLEEQNE